MEMTMKEKTMKRGLSIAAVSAVLLVAVLASCGNPVTGMWIEDVAADSVEDNTFEYTALSGAHGISVFYVGTYEVDKRGKTITLTAAEETDGSQDGANYSWTDSSWTQTIGYAPEGDNLILTLEDGSTITLVTQEQPIEIQRAIAPPN
jgi:hypothetical protein